MPQLGRMLATQHGFDCVALFSQDPGAPVRVDPNYRQNIPALEQLRDTDFMIIATRFRTLPDEQMQEVQNYMKSGRCAKRSRRVSIAKPHARQRELVKIWRRDYRGLIGSLAMIKTDVTQV